jgi:hypothetical protein
MLSIVPPVGVRLMTKRTQDAVKSLTQVYSIQPDRINDRPLYNWSGMGPKVVSNMVRKPLAPTPVLSLYWTTIFTKVAEQG